MLKNVMFDLDGTLLEMDNEEFAQAYFVCLGRYIASFMDEELFRKKLLRATAAMIGNNDAQKLNEEAFMEAFVPEFGAAGEVALGKMMEFYAEHFWQLRKVTRPHAAARTAVEITLAKGAAAVLATNPIFPQLATEQRISWAGLEKKDFLLVTTYENSHFCKPNPAYYEEIMSRMGWQAEECLMIGNDAYEDLAAAELGIRTCLLTDNLVNKHELELKADYLIERKELPDLLERILLKPDL